MTLRNNTRSAKRRSASHHETVGPKKRPLNDRSRSTAGVFPSPWCAFDQDGRRWIQVTTEEDRVNRSVAAQLATDPELYCRGSLLVQIGDDDGHAIITTMPKPLVRDRIAARVQFFVPDETGLFRIPLHPPAWCVDAMTVWRSWVGMRQLAGIITVPTIRPDGSLLESPGYDQATRLLYRPGECLPRVPEQPTAADARSAVDLLFDVIRDFPFANHAHKSTWLAYLLTLVARPAFSGPAPLFAFDATMAGTGKSLLADVAFNIAFGTDAARFSNPTSEEESRKRITTLALAGTPAVLIDNIAGPLGTPSLDAALTSTVWADRLLGANRGVQLPLRIIWAATGNNLILKPDTSRRVAHIRMEAQVERPDLREGFKYPELLSHVKEHRAQLLGAALTIVRAWFVAGRPTTRLPAWGSFEAWSAVARQVITWLGLPDPALCREELRQAADRESAALAELIDGLLDADPDGHGLQAAEIVDRVEKEADSHKLLRSALLELCSTPNGRLGAKSVGRKLAQLRGQIVGGQCIDSHDRRGGAKGWYVRHVDRPAEDMSG